MTASDQYRDFSRGQENPGAIRGKPGSWYARNTRAPRGLGLGEAPDVYDFEPPSFQRLYKIAHSESTVDYVDNPKGNFQTEGKTSATRSVTPNSRCGRRPTICPVVKAQSYRNAAQLYVWSWRKLTFISQATAWGDLTEQMQSRARAQAHRRGVAS